MSFRMILALWVMFWLPQVLLAQTNCNITLKGMVYDAVEERAIPFANVYIHELSSGDVTDLNGNFSVKNICPGKYDITVSHLGCEPIKRTLTLRQDTSVEFTLNHSSVDLETVSIEGHKHDALSGEEAVELGKKEALINSGTTLAKKMESLPGVSSIQTGSNIAKPVVRGMHSNRVLILNNGIRQEGQNWGAEHAPEIDPNLAQNVTLVTGANSIKYGSDAIAGVILIEPNKLPNSKRVNGELNLGGNSNGGGGSVSGTVEGYTNFLGGIGFRAQGSLRKSGTLKSPDYYLSNTGVSEHNFSLAGQKVWGITNTEVFYSQFNTEVGILAYSHIGNLTDLLWAIEQTDIPDTATFTYDIRRPKQQVFHELFKLKESVYLNDQNSIYATYSRQYNERSEFDREKPLGQRTQTDENPEFQYRLTTHMGDVEWENRSLKHWVFKSGINGMYQANTYNGKMFIPNYESRALAGYFIVYRETEKLNYSGGVRYDKRWMNVYRNQSGVVRQSDFEFASPTFSLNAEKKWKNISLQATTGRTFRAPAPNELFSDGLYHGSSALETGDSTLLPETAWNNQLSVNYFGNKDGRSWQARAALFYNQLNNFITLVPTGEINLTIRGAFPSYMYVAQDAVFKGVELSGRYAWPKIQLDANWNVVRALNTQTQSFLPFIPSDNGSLALSYNLIQKTAMEIAVFTKANHVTKQIRGNNFIIANSNNEPQELSDFSPAPNAYTLFNIGVTGKYYFHHSAIEWAVVVENIANTQYRNYMNRQRYFADEPGRNIKINLKIPITFKHH